MVIRKSSINSNLNLLDRELSVIKTNQLQVQKYLINKIITYQLILSLKLIRSLKK